MCQTSGCETRLGRLSVAIRVGVETMPSQQVMDRAARSHYKWTPDELQYLSDRYGRVHDETIARNLGRSIYGMAYAAQRLRQRRKDNFYTANELARALGIPDSDTIIRWAQRGWLKGRKAPMKQRVWMFTEKNIIRCLRQRPWLVDLECMPEHFFRSVVTREWESDPWYTTQQVAPLLEVKNHTTVHDYISRGWLPADKKPHGGPHGGAWVIRHSAIQSFLAKDPRPQSKHESFSEGRRKFLLATGQLSRSAIIWLMRCPRCGQQVMITAPPQLRRGAAVRQRFIDLYLNGNCEHGAHCVISAQGGNGHIQGLSDELQHDTPYPGLSPEDDKCKLSEYKSPISLTIREMTILNYMGQGYLNKQIAAELGISEHTIKNRVSSIMRKLNATGPTQAVVIGLKYKLLSLHSLG